MTDAEKEARVRVWFAMWLQKDCTGIEELFTSDAVYIESWGPEYHGCGKIRHWFEEWNRRGTVLQWEIHAFFPPGRSNHRGMAVPEPNGQR